MADAAYDVDYSYDPATGLLVNTTYPQSEGSYRFAVTNEYAYGLLKRVRRADQGQTVYWEAKDTNAFGQVTEADLIDGAITSRRVYDAVTGRLKTAQAGPGLTSTLQDQAYLWNEVGSLTERSDALIDRRETFDYDDLHRLVEVTLLIDDVPQPNPLVLAYDPMGNILSRSDVGSGGLWSYHAVKKHAVTDADGLSFTYDENGNQVLRGSDPITWSSYNYPTQIENGSARSHRFWYDGNRERWKQEYTLNGVTETTIYVSGLYEKNVHSTDTEHRHYIKAGGQAIGLHIVRENGSDYHRYFLYDHQGSIATVLDGLGGLSFRESFDAFGARRNAATWQGPPSGTEWAEIATTTDQGYTGHHNLQASPLIHMRGRVMDSLTGRFLSADPFVPDPGNTQSWNRYSYVRNNPLSLIDPSGFREKKPNDDICEYVTCSDGDPQVDISYCIENPGICDYRGERDPGMTITERDITATDAGEASRDCYLYGECDRKDEGGGKSQTGDGYRDYDRDRPSYHAYTVYSQICDASQQFGCSAQYVFDEGLLRYPAPGFDGTTKIQNLQIESVPGLGDVRFRVYPGDLKVINATLPSHALHPGYVERQVLEVGNRILIRTRGIGAGPYAPANEALSGLLWYNLDRQITRSLTGIFPQTEL